VLPVDRGEPPFDPVTKHPPLAKVEHEIDSDTGQDCDKHERHNVIPPRVTVAARTYVHLTRIDQMFEPAADRTPFEPVERRSSPSTDDC
jgi:hypothetical protein